MASNLIRIASQQLTKVPQRCIATSSIRPLEDVISVNKGLSESQIRDRNHPQIGSREIVGFGTNGSDTYFDENGFPFPAIRFKNDTEDVLALRAKEKGDWKNLTLEEKKDIYRANFCQTYSEMNANNGEWKALVAGTILVLGLTGWIYLGVKKYMYPPIPDSISEQWKEDTVKRMVIQRQGLIEGISAKFDYDKSDWK